MGRWSNSDTGKETGDSSSKVAAAEHKARDDAQKSGDFERGNNSKNSERFDRDSDAGKAATGLWNSIFGK
jgi:hypothetical protein